MKINMDDNKIIIYNTDDGKNSVKLFAEDGTVWLNQQLMAELFDTSKQNISLHIINILEDNELDANSVVKDYLTTAAELIVSRADAGTPNMALTAWKGKIVRKQDIYIAENYLTEDEIDTVRKRYKKTKMKTYKQQVKNILYLCGKYQDIIRRYAQ